MTRRRKRMTKRRRFSVDNDFIFSQKQKIDFTPPCSSNDKPNFKIPNDKSLSLFESKQRSSSSTSEFEPTFISTPEKPDPQKSSNFQHNFRLKSNPTTNDKLTSDRNNKKEKKFLITKAKSFGNFNCNPAFSDKKADNGVTKKDLELLKSYNSSSLLFSTTKEKDCQTPKLGHRGLEKELFLRKIMRNKVVSPESAPKKSPLTPNPQRSCIIVDDRGYHSSSEFLFPAERAKRSLRIHKKTKTNKTKTEELVLTDNDEKVTLFPKITSLKTAKVEKNCNDKETKFQKRR